MTEIKGLLQGLITALPMMVSMFWAAVIALDIRHDGNRAAHRELFWWTVATALLYACHVVFFAHALTWLPLSDTLYVAMNLAVYPAFLYYILTLTRGEVSKKTKISLLLPPPLCGAIVGLLYALMSSDECRQFIHTYLYNNSFSGLAGLCLAQALVHHLCKLLFGVGVVLVYFCAKRNIRAYHRLVDNVYADEEGKKLHSVSLIMTLMMAITVISIVANIIGRHVFVENAALAIPSLLFSMLIFALAWTGSRQQYGFADIKEVHEEPAADMQDNAETAPPPDGQGESRTPNTCGKAQELAVRIDRLMDDEQLYLVSGLKVSDLAQRLNTNVRYIQQALNEELNMSFAEYVNRRRVAHAAKLQNQYPGIDILTLSVKSGFASITSYYRNVKKYS
ncbi:MAG: helix-turn-helix domain-containing protein [Prevotella sp.]|nr:helix-turn-helix domain-containing protein [Prevotella sp.]